MKNGRLVSRNRSIYRRLLRLESLETRSLMAADFLDTSNLTLLSETSLIAEGESSLPAMGFMPAVPDDLAARLREQAANSGNTSGVGAGSANLIPLTDVFLLHSRPSATKTIFLDFDGFTAVGTSWNRSSNITTIVSPAYDPAGNGPGFTNGELADIRDVWHRVAADFSPFDVNVTTEDPGEGDLVNEGGTDVRWGIRVVMTLVDFSNSGAGGFAYINSFGWNYESVGATDTPCYVFNNLSFTVATAVTHEVGHSLGLSHDGTTAANPIQPNAEYYNGHGTGENSWGPIMGVGGYYRNVTTWDDGTYLGANNGSANANYRSGPSDLDVITTQNGFGYVSDDHSNVLTGATPLVGASLPGGRQSISSFGTISETNDFDYFRFQTGSGPIDITIDPYVNELWTSDGNGGFVRSLEDSFLDATNWSNNQGSNLDVEATIYDSAGIIVAVANQIGLRASFTNLVLSVGTYYLRVDGVGFGTPQADPPTGYSQYASLGQYQITGTIASSIDIRVGNTAVSYTENTAPSRIASAAVFTTFNINSFAGGILLFNIAANFQTGDRLAFLSTGTAAGQVSFSGSDVSFGGVLIGRVSPGVQTRSVTFNSAATIPSIQAVIRAITFEHTTDGPSLNIRDVTIFLDNRSNGVSNLAVAQVTVIPVNDSPLMENVSLQAVLEDTPNPPGLRVSAIVGTGFQDVDLNARLTGIAVTQNSALPQNGVWEYSVNGTQWVAIGAVSPTTSLLLSRNSWVRFLPAANFDASPSPLRIRGIDETYTGVFSTQTVRTSFDVTQAIINGPFSLTDTLLDTRVVPVNDPPVATIGPMSRFTDEDSQFEFLIPSTWFEDVDDTNLQLSVFQSNGQELPLWLNLNAATGMLSGVPTNDDVGDFSFIIRSTDPSGASAEIPLSLTVVNTNDTPTGVVLVGNSITENTSNVFVGTLFGRDPDSTDTVSFSVTDMRFLVRGNQLFVAPDQAINFEQTPFIDLIVRVTDSGSPALFLNQSIRINVIDVNEFAPGLSPVTFRISEVLPASSAAGSLIALDGDTAQRVRYRFVGTAPTLFALNTDTGIVSLRSDAELDFERTDSYQFFVEAYDSGAPQLATTASVNIVIEDDNEFAPIISTNSISLSEAQPPDVVFATIQASDLDMRQLLVYSVVAPETRFLINPATGALSLARSGLFDYEQTTSTTLTARVTDPGGRFEEKVITVNITDSNDPPTAATVTATTLESNVTDVDLGPLTIVDQDFGQLYTIQVLDDRFIVQNGRLILAPGKSISESDPVNLVIPIIAREVGSNSLSYPLSINVGRVSNLRPWQNRLNPLNVNKTGGVDPLDVLALVNAINGNRQGALPSPRSTSTSNESDYDVDGDGFLTPLDVLLVVNFLNGTSNSPPPGGEGEGGDVDNSSASLWLTAYNQLEEERLGARRRRS